MPRFTWRRVKRSKKGFARRSSRFSFRGRLGKLRRAAFSGPSRPIAAPGAESRIVYRKYTLWDTAIQTTIVAGVATGVGKNMATFVGAFGNSANMLSTYDEYAIVNWKVTFVPAQTESLALAITGGTLLGNLPVYGLSIDTNGGVATPSAIGDILIYDNAKTSVVTRQLTTGWFQPKPAALIYDGMTSDYMAPEGADGLNWIRSVDSTAAHYGVLVYVEPSSFTTTAVTASGFNVKQELIVAFRGGK